MGEWSDWDNSTHATLITNTVQGAESIGITVIIIIVIFGGILPLVLIYWICCCLWNYRNLGRNQGGVGKRRVLGPMGPNIVFFEMVGQVCCDCKPHCFCPSK